MAKRTTIEIDEELLARAKRALGCTTARATVEAALQRAVADADRVLVERHQRQLAFLDRIEELIDLDVLRSDDMWR